MEGNYGHGVESGEFIIPPIHDWKRYIRRCAIAKAQDSLNYRIKHLQSNTVFDVVLTRFSAALNHIPTTSNDFIDDWSLNMRASMKRLDDSGLAYEYFLSDCQYDSANHSTPHVLSGIDYNNCEADQISFPDWLKKNIIEDKPLSVGSKLLGSEIK